MLVGKKSRYVRQAVRPPSRTIEAGKSTEILAKVYIKRISEKKGKDLQVWGEGTHTKSLFSKVDELDVQELLAEDGNGTAIDHIGDRAA